MCKNIFKSSDIRLTWIRNNIVLKMSRKHFANFGTVCPILKIQRAKLVKIKFLLELQ